MKKGLTPSVAFLVLLILFSGCGKNEEPTKKGETTTKDTITQRKLTARFDSIEYKQFFQIKSHVSTNLNSISYYNTSRGIAVGDSGTIILTKNGGHDWQSVGGVTKVNLYGAVMVNSLIAIAVGEKGTILRSKDGGKTWAAVISQNSDFPKTLRAVAFYSCTDGYTVGDSGLIFVTHDAGMKWKKIGSSSGSFNSIAFSRSNRPNIVGNNGVYIKGKDIDLFTGGADFTEFNLRSIHFELGNGPFMNSDTGFAVGDRGVIYKTTDGGEKWSYDTSHVKKNLRGVFTHSSRLAYAVGDSGTILRYNGIKWIPLPPSTPKRINAVDPVYWNPTSTCVGEDGLMMFINPPPVNDNGTTATIQGQEDCIWTMTLSTKSLFSRDPLGNRIEYKRFEVCSSIEQSDMEIVPGSGWVLREQYRNISADLAPNQEYPSQQYPLNSITLLMNPNSEVTSGYLSLYLKDEQENFYLLSTYEIQCSP